MFSFLRRLYWRYIRRVPPLPPEQLSIIVEAARFKMSYNSPIILLAEMAEKRRKERREERGMCSRCDVFTLRMGRSSFEPLQRLLENNKLMDGDKEVRLEFRTVMSPQLELWTTTQGKEKEA